jgi:hypothetical protein
MPMKTGTNFLAGRRKQISIILTIAAVLLWTHSILYARLEIGHFGLIHSLPVTFFVALALLTVASAILWISKEKHNKLLLLQLLLLLAAFYLIPLVSGGSIPFMKNAYSNLGLTNYIIQEGNISPGLWYLSWPGAHVLFSAMAMVGAINFEPVLQIFSNLMLLASLLPLYLFLKNIMGEGRTNYCWAGLWLYFISYWGSGAFGSPQGTGFFLLITVLAIITLPSLWKKGPARLALLATAGVLAIAIVPTHLLTSLILVLMLAVFSAVKRTKRLLPIIGLCLVLIVCWDVTGGGHISTSATSQPLWSPAMETPITAEETPAGETPAEETPGEEAPMPEREKPAGVFTLNPGAIAQTEITRHLRGTESHIAVVKVRVLHSAIFALIGIAGAIFVLLFRRKPETWAILAISLTPLLLLPISGHYGEELMQRVYLFSLPFMAYFGAMLLDMKSKLPWLIICLLLIIACPTKVIATYGNQALDYFPPGRVAVLKFFDSTTTRGYVTGASPLGSTSNMLQYKRLDYSQLGWEENKLYTQARAEMPYYIAISNRDRAWYEWFWGNPCYINDIEQLLDNAVNCGLIYNNPAVKLYESDE